MCKIVIMMKIVINIMQIYYYVLINDLKVLHNDINVLNFKYQRNNKKDLCFCNN